MTDSWDEMRKAKEGEYFERKNRLALERLAKKKTEKVLTSPVSGQPMEKVVIDGVVIDRCPTSGGIWLDAGELEELLKAHDKGTAEEHHAWFSGFLKNLVG